VIRRIGSAISPTVVLCLTIVWLVLQETMAPEQILLGALLVAALIIDRLRTRVRLT